MNICSNFLFKSLSYLLTVALSFPDDLIISSRVDDHIILCGSTSDDIALFKYPPQVH